MEVVVVLIAAVLVVQEIDAVTTIAVLSHVFQQLLSYVKALMRNGNSLIDLL